MKAEIMQVILTLLLEDAAPNSTDISKVDANTGKARVAVQIVEGEILCRRFKMPNEVYVSMGYAVERNGHIFMKGVDLGKPKDISVTHRNDREAEMSAGECSPGTKVLNLS